MDSSKGKRNTSTWFEWFVIYCEDDDSHSVVPEKDVIFDKESVALLPGDEVVFFDGGKKWRGVVKDMGDDYNTMVKSRDKMNAMKPKRDRSFQAGQPRKAKLKCNEALQSRQLPSKAGSSDTSKSSVDSTQDEHSMQKGKETPSTSGDQQSKQRNGQSLVKDLHVKPQETQVPLVKNILKGKVLSQAEDYSLSTDASSDEALTEEEMMVLAKKAKRKKQLDVKELAKLATKSFSKGSVKDIDDDASPIKAKKKRTSTG